jgi:2-dehydrotetronate isomerase
MPKFAANLSFFFQELAFLDRFDAAAKAGFRAVEFLFPYEWPKDEIAARLKVHGLTLALFNARPGDFAKGERGIAAIPGREAEFEVNMREALAYADALGAKRLHVMPGLRHHGTDRATYIKNLALAARMAAHHGITILIEPINHRDIPGFFLSKTADARAVVHEVRGLGHANIAIQFDLYHRQIEEGDTTTALREYFPLVGHMQIANPPDRAEPDDGEMNYAFLFKEIDRLGFDGYVGCEYKPRASTLAGLGWAERLGVRLG